MWQGKKALTLGGPPLVVRNCAAQRWEPCSHGSKRRSGSTPPPFFLQSVPRVRKSPTTAGVCSPPPPFIISSRSGLGNPVAEKSLGKWRRGTPSNTFGESVRREPFSLLPRLSAALPDLRPLKSKVVPEERGRETREPLPRRTDLASRPAFISLPACGC